MLECLHRILLVIQVVEACDFLLIQLSLDGGLALLPPVKKVVHLRSDIGLEVCIILGYLHQVQEAIQGY